LTHILDTRGRFGCEEERSWWCAIGMNEKGGMTDNEFEKYIDNSIVPLNPDLEDMPGKRVKRRVEFHARRETALPILDRLEHELENDVAQLTNKELEVLLRWKGVAASKMGNVANRRLLYQQLAEGDVVEEASIPAPWTEIDEAELIALRDAPIAMCDTAYGRFEEQKKRDVERAYQMMSAAEKEIFKKKMAEIDEADAGVDEESPPPTPTPV